VGRQLAGRRGAAVWAFWLDPDGSVVERDAVPVAAAAAPPLS